MVAIAGSGTKTTDGTEQILATIGTAGVYSLAIDLGNMVLGDELEVRIKTKVLSGSSSRLAYFNTYKHNQGTPNAYSIPVPSHFECIITIKRVGGSDRAYDWLISSH